MNNRHKRKNYIPLAQINMTPLVDVVFVLLIVFMISAPMLTVGVPVDLPETKAASLNNDEKDPLVVTINNKKEIYVQEKKVSKDGLMELIDAISSNNKDFTIYVKGDRKLNYGEVMQVMGLISDGGYKKVSLIAEMPN